ncbi:MAG: SH3 domain-containing protein, partial [Muribaculum sp.]|nr:SH3 domain-containing protein [Muribaculum sp.]
MRYLIRLYTLIAIIFLSATSCSSSDKTPDSSDTEELLYIADVKTQLNVREKPSAQSQILGYYLPGDTVHVVGIEGNWATAVSRYGEIGYVITDHLKPLYSMPSTAEAPVNITAPKHLFAVIDSVGALTEAEKIELSALTAILGRPVIVFATDTVPVDQIIAQPKNVHKALRDSEYKSILDSTAIFCWTTSSKLLQYTDETKATEYMMLTYPEKYFDTQLLANTDGVVSGTTEMSKLIANCQKEFQGFNWFVRNNISKQNFVDTVCDGFIADNILPNDTFWHNWIFRWLFKFPFIFASFILSLFGSTLW